MLKQVLDIIGQAYSGAAAKRSTAAIARHHRMQASPGYRAAAHWLLAALQQGGLDAHIERFPADLNTHFWTLSSFQEWDCRSATLDWMKPEGPQRLCDYRASALSVIQRSVAAAGEFGVVDVGAGSEADYAGKDVAGKLVLSRANVMQTYREAVQKRGAAGVLFDHIDATAPGRNRIDLPDARQYASFWWLEPEPQGWGFVLTPRQGDAIRTSLGAGEDVRMRVAIDARLYDGELEDVVAVIPGSEPGALLATAHLCHPQDFANDNASGAAALLETAVTLQRLIAAGELPQPQRTLIFLWIPEMTGTVAWLDRNESMIPDIVAGINLDMVGQDQTRTGSVLLIDSPPAATASFAPALLARLRDDFTTKHFSFQQVNTPLQLIRSQTIPFSGGSDHMITSDPTVGIPTPMLIQWPDSFYHTTADTMEMVDERSLWLAGTLAGSYLMWLANAGREQAHWLGWEMLYRYEAETTAFVRETLALQADAAPAEKDRAWRELDAGLTFRQERMRAALASLLRLAPVENEVEVLIRELAEFSDGALDRARRRMRPSAMLEQNVEPNPWALSARGIIPQRLYRGPIMEMGSPEALFPFNDEDLATWRSLADDVPKWRLVRALAEYWTDGERDLAEIARLTAMETGQHAGPTIERWFRLLEKAGLMVIQ